MIEWMNEWIKYFQFFKKVRKKAMKIKNKTLLPSRSRKRTSQVILFFSPFIQLHESNSADYNYFSSSTQKSKTFLQINQQWKCSKPEKFTESVKMKAEHNVKTFSYPSEQLWSILIPSMIIAINTLLSKLSILVNDSGRWANEHVRECIILLTILTKMTSFWQNIKTIWMNEWI